jgi:hypothetical protein
LPTSVRGFLAGSVQQLDGEVDDLAAVEARVNEFLKTGVWNRE